MSVNSSMISLRLMGTYPYHTLAAVLLGYTLFRLSRKGRNGNPKGLSLPPGPKGYPLIGNLFDMPVYKPWLVYEEWCKIYGDMVYFNVFGQHFLVLGSQQRIDDLFEKRSANYSDRMRLPMVVELMKWDSTVPFLRYGAEWRKHRKLLHEHFQPSVVSKYLPIQKREVHAFLRRLLVTPENLYHHTRHLFAATIMKISYGIDVRDADDPYISLAEIALNGLTEAGILGTYWVDLAPILKYVPSWFPGAGFQKKAAYLAEVNAIVMEKPFRHVEKQLNQGKAGPSIAATLIDRLPHQDDPQRPIEEKLARAVTAEAYLGGADTTASVVQTLFLAMALYPEVQKKAQAEIDAVVGPDRLPGFEDRPFLPYISAVVKESLRWHLVAPLAFPHMATNDDEYNGYYIPKGTIVFGNAWSILHNPKIFDNPMEYQPERYLKDGRLNPDVINQDSLPFGFGRRICPGRYLSDNALFCIVSCILAACDIEPPVDDQGNVIQLKPEFTNGILSHPVPFTCIIKPRTPADEALLRESVDEDS